MWRITGLLRNDRLESDFITSLCFPDYAPEYGMSDLNGDCVAFLGREHETPIISINKWCIDVEECGKTKWRLENEEEFDQAKFRPDFSPVIPVCPVHLKHILYETDMSSTGFRSLTCSRYQTCSTSCTCHRRTRGGAIFHPSI